MSPFEPLPTNCRDSPLNQYVNPPKNAASTRVPNGDSFKGMATADLSSSGIHGREPLGWDGLQPRDVRLLPRRIAHIALGAQPFPVGWTGHPAAANRILVQVIHRAQHGTRRAQTRPMFHHPYEASRRLHFWISQQ